MRGAKPQITARILEGFDEFLKSYPGTNVTLARLLEVVAAERGNVITVSHNRLSPHIALGKTRIELLVEVRDLTAWLTDLTAAEVKAFNDYRSNGFDPTSCHPVYRPEPCPKALMPCDQLV